MTNLLKIALAVTLFAGSMMAEGQMGSGGRNCPGAEGCPPPCSENCGRPVVEDEPTLIDKIVRNFAKFYFTRF